MLTIFGNKIKYTCSLCYCGNGLTKGMQEDVFATHRNGHALRDTFDKEHKTLDIYSNGIYPSNVLSNLAKKEFVLDGIACSSIEGFLQSLKIRDIDEQTKICALFGGSAKKAASKNTEWMNTQKLYWLGKEYDRDSEEYQELIYRAFSECYRQNNVFRSALDSTKGITLTHSNGKNDKTKTILTADEFIQILTKMRDNR